MQQQRQGRILQHGKLDVDHTPYVILFKRWLCKTHEDRNAFNKFVRPHGYTQCILVSNTEHKHNFVYTKTPLLNAHQILLSGIDAISCRQAWVLILSQSLIFPIPEKLGKAPPMRGSALQSKGGVHPCPPTCHCILHPNHP